MLYSEFNFNIPDHIFSIIIKTIDRFEIDLKIFKETVFAEAEIIPEVTFKVNHLFEILERLTVFDRFKENKEFQIDEKQELLIKRAQLYSVNEFFDNFFVEIINDVKSHTTVKKKFIKQLYYINTNEFREENRSEQIEGIKRYIEYMKLHSKDSEMVSEMEKIFDL